MLVTKQAMRDMADGRVALAYGLRKVDDWVRRRAHSPRMEEEDRSTLQRFASERVLSNQLAFAAHFHDAAPWLKTSARRLTKAHGDDDPMVRIMGMLYGGHDARACRALTVCNERIPRPMTVERHALALGCHGFARAMSKQNKKTTSRCGYDAVFAFYKALHQGARAVQDFRRLHTHAWYPLLRAHALILARDAHCAQQRRIARKALRAARGARHNENEIELNTYVDHTALRARVGMQALSFGEFGEFDGNLAQTMLYGAWSGDSWRLAERHCLWCARDASVVVKAADGGSLGCVILYFRMFGVDACMRELCADDAGAPWVALPHRVQAVGNTALFIAACAGARKSPFASCAARPTCRAALSRRIRASLDLLS